MSPNAKKLVRYTMSFGIAGVLLVMAFRSVNWQDFMGGIKGASWTMIALSILCGLCAFVIRALRWNMQLRPIDNSIGLRDTFDAVCIGNLANCAIPFAGEFVRCGVASTRKAGYDKVLGTIALERLWDLVSVMVAVIMVIAIKSDSFGAFFHEHVWLPASGRFGSDAWIIIAATAFIAISAAVAVILLRKRNRVCASIWNIISGIFSGFSSFLKMDRKGLFLIYTIILWVLYWLMSLCIIEAVPQSAGVLKGTDALFIMAVGSIASVVPAPGGFGAYHYIVAMALTSLYAAAFPAWTSAIVFAVLSHESQALAMITTGLGCLVRHSVKKRES